MKLNKSGYVAKELVGLIFAIIVFITPPSLWGFLVNKAYHAVPIGEWQDFTQVIVLVVGVIIGVSILWTSAVLGLLTLRFIAR